MVPNPATITAGLRFLERLFPAADLDDLTSESIEALREKYKARDRWNAVLLVCALVGLAVVYYFALTGLGSFVHRRFDDAKFLLSPPAFVLGIFAACLSLFSSGFVVFQAMRLALGRQEYAVYLAYGARRSRRSRKFDAGKVFLWMFLVFFSPLAIATAMYATMYTAFTDRAIFDSSFWSFGFPTEHAYLDLRSIYLAQGYHARFQDVARTCYVITFEHGDQWRSSRSPTFIGGKAIMQYVAQRSGRPIQIVNFIEDIPH